MLVTLMVDSSISADGSAGFGFWCKSNIVAVSGGDVLTAPAKDSYIGELMGVIKALNICIKNNYINKFDNVMIQIDNTGVLQLLQYQKKIRDDVIPLVEIFNKMVSDNHLTLRYKHVKAHSGRKDVRFRSNNLCDKTARKFMEKKKMSLRNNVTVL